MDCLMDYMEEETRQKCYRVWRIIAYGANSVFALFGILLISIGATAMNSFQEYNFFYKNTIPSGLVVVGVFMLITVLIGFIGIKRKKPIILGIYIALMSILIICEFSVGGAAYAKRNSISQQLQNSWKNADPNSKNSIQTTFGCCGWINSTDFPGPNCVGNKTINSTNNFNLKKSIIIKEKLIILSNQTLPGCASQMISTFQNQLYIVGTIGILFATFEIVGFIAISIILACHRFEISERSYSSMKF
jgi:ABC-type transport system involved in multi-copper enzyme maturation permease subunit